MSDKATVLYDHPGPRAKRLNLVISVIFAAVLIAGIWWVIDILAGKGQLTAAKWSPFLEGQNWTTYLLPGLLNTLKAAAISVVIALPIGALLGIARLSDHAWIRVPAGIVVEFFRAIPVLILMSFSFLLWFEVFGFSSPLAGVVIGLVLYNGSVLAEIFRAGILSLPRGQTEASLAIGLGKTQMMTNVLLPQALTAMLPAVVSQLVVVVKDTALGGILVGYVELRRMAGTSASNYQNLLPTYVVIAVIYILLNLALGFLASYLEKRLRTRRGGGRRGGAAEPMAVTTAKLNTGGV
ncbi:ABC transporter permease subunit [Nakamurella sp. YIM 132087]|uniref:ABC transporter permease subunit n=1 Tax=Nakamurella alba TaxID=2665158 RepID=A0A7K1FQX5_9ACTN|nr:amino acid ABC transporter permease [Nakamurella alba]MTD16551.1 ABC transporter permease subunit [Nakamurella alba]